LDNLDNTARLITGKPLSKTFNSKAEPERITTKTRTLSNRNVTELVRKYIAEKRRAFTNPSLDEFKRDALLDVPTIVTWLKDQDITGKDRYLNAAVHVILKKEAAKEETELHYKKGLGYFKGNAPADTLVASA
jgi:hypothetical protein